MNSVTSQFTSAHFTGLNVQFSSVSFLLFHTICSDTCWYQDMINPFLHNSVNIRVFWVSQHCCGWTVTLVNYCSRKINHSCQNKNWHPATMRRSYQFCCEWSTQNSRDCRLKIKNLILSLFLIKRSIEIWV